MKLYYTPGACSMASHIVLRELGHDFEIERVDAATKVTEHGRDFRAINPKGKVPVLAVAGEVLTEGPSILQYLADSAANRDLAPAAGTMARARVNEALNFIATELHVAFHPFFNPAADDAAKATARAQVESRLSYLEAALADGRAHLTGAGFTIADAYAFVVCTWTASAGIELARWPLVAAFVARVGARPAAQAAAQAEARAA